MSLDWFIPLDWYDYVLLGVVVLIPALLLWRAWTVRRQADLETSFSRLIKMTLAAGAGWFLATIPFNVLFAACCSDFPYAPLKLVMTKWLYTNTLGIIFTPNFWAVPLLLFVVGLLGFTLAKFRLDIAIILLGVVSFIALVVFATTGSTGGTLAGVLPGAKGALLYPGSEDGLVHRIGCSTRDSCTISFVAPAGQDDVWSFYERELPKSGWQRVHEQKSPYILAFERSEPGKELSSRFLLFMSSYTTGEGSKNTHVTLGTYRRPDMQKLPVYPGAQDAKMIEERLQAGVVQSTTTYRVSNQPEEVEAWYRSILLADKSWQDETEKEHVREGLLFRFYKNGMSEFVVIASQTSGGQTQVKVRGLEHPLLQFFLSQYNTKIYIK
ncbi:MAG TPA: hypothetical protein VGE45_16365 [Chloroflexia bacterium]|jgi:hypothetical protein